MTPATLRLAATLKKITSGADGLGDWAQSSERLIPGERIALQDSFTRVSARAHAMAGLLTQPATLGVFGAPRSGKTHVITSLLARGPSPLMVKFDGIAPQINVVRQIMPVGARHMASAAIRYSARRRPMHRGFPLTLRLLSLTEVADILAAAYLAQSPNARATPMSAAALRQLHQDVEGDLKNVPVGGMTEADTLALKDYICTAYALHPHVQALSAAGYWDSLAELAPTAPTEARVRLLQCLWNGERSFTAAFSRLAEALDALSHSRDAATTLDAVLEPDPQTGQLMRHAESILSAESFSTLLSARDETIVVLNQFGQWMSVDRAALAALVAEVRFAVEGPPGSLPEQADVVEFPGITTPDGVVVTSIAEDTEGQRFSRQYARAKQQFLHARAVSSGEITALLACIDCESGVAGELAPYVSAWVHRTLGATAEAREAADSGLFIMATKLDRLLGEHAGRERGIDWDQVIGKGLGALAGDMRLEDEWTPSRPFDGFSIGIAPTFKTIGLFEQGRTQAVKATLKARIARLREAFLASAAVQRHIAQPAMAWDEALSGGDGGTLRLAKAIQDVCHARTKQRQIVFETHILRQTLRDSSMRYVAGEGSASDRRYAYALQVTRRLRHAAMERRLNRLFAALSIRDGDLAEVFHDLSNRIAMSGSRATQFIARAAIDAWVTRIRDVVRGRTAAGLDHLPASALRHLVDELVAGANRIKLEERIIKRITEASADELSGDAYIEAASVAAAATLNGFPLTLGFDNFLANDHPRRRDAQATPVFSRAASADDTPEAWARDDEVVSPELEQHSDWAQAYLAFVEENMRDLAEMTLPAAEAATLKLALGALEQAQ